MVVPKAGQRPAAAHISEPAPSTSLDPPPPDWGTFKCFVWIYQYTQSCALFTAVVDLHNVSRIKGLIGRSDMGGGLQLVKN